MLNGEPIVVLEGQGPGIVSAQIAPGRGMLLLQATVRDGEGREHDLLATPPLEEAIAALGGGPEDFAGNRAFSFGGAILAPYANRIRGRQYPATREIEARIGEAAYRLPANWSGKAPGAEPYAMHGLILDQPVRAWRQPEPGRLTGRLDAADFGGRWPSRTQLTFDWGLADGGLELAVQARNIGEAPLPMGIGWHPWFALPSGDRAQARLRLPAARRALVDGYDQVLPTRQTVAVAGSPYDFRAGRALDGLYLDDCFYSLARDVEGAVQMSLADPAAGYGLRLTARSPAIKAIQVYAPPDRALVVIEPQFNLADPFGDVWPEGFDTGMAWLRPGESVRYDCRVDVVDS